MTKLFWYTTCHHCEQGRLFLFVDTTNDKIYLHCEECEWGWNDPEDLRPEAGFLTVDKDFDGIPATLKDISRFNWEKYAKETDDE